MNRTGLAFLLLTLLTGCVHSKRNQATLPSGLGFAHLLYFQPEPHRSLYVEVDAVEGAEFSDTELNNLKAFLSQWCQKPDGVTVLKSSVIPRSAALGHSADSLARRYVDGPMVATDAAQPAYLYILVYDSRVNRNPAQSPRGASQRAAREKISLKLASPENPHVAFFPYPAMIYMDRSWLGGLLPKKYWYDTLIHETGHVLGMVRRESRAEGFHCPAKWCQMHGHVSGKVKSDVMNWLKREKPKSYFCDDCVAELRQFKTSTNGTSERFIGPVLVRTMPSYHVLSLPAFCGLYIGDSVEAEIPRFIEQFRKLPGLKGPWLIAHAQDNQDRESLLQAIETAKQDLDPHVRAAASRLERSVRGKEMEAPDHQERP